MRGVLLCPKKYKQGKDQKRLSGFFPISLSLDHCTFAESGSWTTGCLRAKAADPQLLLHPALSRVWAPTSLFELVVSLLVDVNFPMLLGASICLSVEATADNMLVYDSNGSHRYPSRHLHDG